MNSTHANNQPEVMLERFKPEEYYVLKRDPRLKQEINLVPVIRPEGIKLLMKYYAAKYGTSMSYPAKEQDEELAKRTVNDRDTQYLTSWEFLKNYAEQLLKPLREQKTDEVRHAFMLGLGEGHKIPAIYLREKIKGDDGKEQIIEALLFANTLSSESSLSDLKEFKKQTGIQVLLVEDQRQADFHICGIDAVVFGRDTTAKNKNGEYRIPHLLAKLLARCVIKEGYNQAILPDQFLKTAQISKFVTAHQEIKPKEMHVRSSGERETLVEFRERYTYKDVLLKLGEDNIAMYAKLKGGKFANLIEIQFYLNEFNKIAPDLMKNPNLRKAFIRNAKLFLKKQKLDDNVPRAGLYEFAFEFLLNHVPGVKKKKEFQQETRNNPSKYDMTWPEDAPYIPIEHDKPPLEHEPTKPIEYDKPPLEDEPTTPTENEPTNATEYDKPPLEDDPKYTSAYAKILPEDENPSTMDDDDDYTPPESPRGP